MISKARFWLLLKRLICDKVSNTVSAVARARQEEKEEALPAVYRLGLAKVNDRESYIVKVHLGSMAVRPDNKSCLAAKNANCNFYAFSRNVLFFVVSCMLYGMFEF